MPPSAVFVRIIEFDLRYENLDCRIHVNWAFKEMTSLFICLFVCFSAYHCLHVIVCIRCNEFFC